MMDYLQSNEGDAKYLVASADYHIAESITLNTDEPVISLGGFSGRDPIFSTEKLAGLVDEGAVRFFLVKQKGERKNKSLVWIQDNCEQVPQDLWQSSRTKKTGGSNGKGVLLYDCATRTQ